MKIKAFILALLIAISIGSVVSMSGCSAGAHVGSVGAGASVY